MTLFDILEAIRDLGLIGLGVFLYVRTSRALEDLMAMGWTMRALDGNVRYLVGLLSTYHAKPAETAEEREERDRDVAEIKRLLASPGPGLMEWDQADDVLKRYGWKHP